MKFLLLLVSLPAAMAMHGTLRQTAHPQPAERLPVIRLARGAASEIPGVIIHLPWDANGVSRRDIAATAIATPQSLVPAITAPAANYGLPASAGPARQIAGFLLERSVDEGIVPSLLDAASWPGEMSALPVPRLILLTAPSVAMPLDRLLEAINPASGAFSGVTAGSPAAAAP